MISEVWPMAVPLRKRDGSIRAYALVDADDYEVVMRHRWHAVVDSTGRLRPVCGRKKRYLYRELLGLGPGDPEVDHRNGETLDNRRANLRVATRGQNNQNLQGATRLSRSGIRGVFWDKARSRWSAEVKLGGEHYHLGRFDEMEQAEAVVVAFRRAHMPFSDMDR